MTQFMNFKRVEVSGSTREEAIAKAPFTVMGDATQAYKNWRKNQVNGVTDSDKMQFMLDYLKNKTKNVEGLGYSITIDSAIADTRQRPYTIESVKNTGTRRWSKVFELRDAKTGVLLAATNPGETLQVAKELGKELYTDGNFKGNVVATATKQVTEGEPIVFKMTYTPSKNARVGTYLCFGIEKA